MFLDSIGTDCSASGRVGTSGQEDLFGPAGEGLDAEIELTGVVGVDAARGYRRDSRTCRDRGPFNIRRDYAKAREEDLLATHILIPPQVNRAVAGTQRPEASSPRASSRRTTAASPSTAPGCSPPSRRSPTRCSGLRCIAGEPLDHDRPTHDHPLSSRFEESDCVVVFDNAELCNGFYSQTNSVNHMTHQVVTRPTPPGPSTSSAWCRC